MSSYEELTSRDSIERARSPSPILSLDEERSVETILSLDDERDAEILAKTLSDPALQEVDISTRSPDSIEDLKARESYHDSSPRLEKLKSLFSEKWEENPAEIEQRASAGFITWDTSILFLDLFWAMLIPVLFMTLAIVAARLDMQSTEGMGDWGIHVERAIQLGPSIWPIVFAAIVGRSMKAVARYKAERGSTIGLLEQFIGSTTVLGTLECIYELRSLRPLSIVLLALWALSPLGGQATLRLLSRRTLSTTQNTPLRFLNTSVPQNVNFDDVQRYYQAAMVAPQSIKNSPRDVWGSIKIPLYDWTAAVERPTIQSEADTWLDVNSSTNYSSLIGIPIVGIPETGKFQLNLTAGYFDFHVLGLGVSSNQTLNFSQVDSLLPLLTFPWKSDSNQSNSSGIFVDNATDTATDWFLDTATPFTTRPVAPYQPRNITFGARSSNPTSIGLIHLNVTFMMVEIQCECDSGQCAAAKLRPSKQEYQQSDIDVPDPFLTPLDDQDVTERTFTQLPLIDGKADTRTSVNYLQDSTPSESSVSSDDTSQGIDVRLWANDPQDFAERFTVIFNTFWLSSIAPWQGGPLPNISALESKNPVFASESVIGLAIALEEVYVCNWGWFILVISASIVTFFCGILNAVIRYQSLAPDVLGYVSSLTRDNPHCKVPGGGSLLDGIDRARLLKDVKVRLEDVRPHNEIGHVAFAASDGDKFSAGRLRWGRLYD